MVGKSTLLKCIADAYCPQSGNVYIGGGYSRIIELTHVLDIPTVHCFPSSLLDDVEVCRVYNDIVSHTTHQLMLRISVKGPRVTLVCTMIIS